MFTSEHMGIDLACLESGLSVKDLEENSIHISNITATVNIEGEFDRAALAADLPNSQYNPEKHRSLIFRSTTIDGVVVLLPRAGRASITGAQSSEDLITGVKDFMSALSDIGMEREYADIEVENIVATTDFGHNLDLSELTVVLGLEAAEYEPEQFPGIIYRTNNDSVVLIYSSGKAIITKTRTLQEVLTTYQDLQNRIDSLSTV